ncbi:MAG: NUDIX domain-containing protein, partial [Agathobacter sp.]
PSKGLLAGMYQFLNLSGQLTEDEALNQVRRMNLHPMHIKKLEDAVHIFSHVEWHMTGYMIQVDSLTREEANVTFVALEEAQKSYAIPSAFAAYTKYLELKLGIQ